MKTATMGIALFCLLAAVPLPAYAGRTVTLYLDGAVVEQDASARKGYLEITLPPGARADSLRIKPQPGTDIIRVVTLPLLPSRKLDKELALLASREELLLDRLQALATREEIFKGAAKSQSAKAPKKTKSNPDPLAALRQGTDYAIAQLEAVYQARRRTEKELKQLAEKRASMKGGEQVGGTVARVWLTPANGGVKALYCQVDRSWAPAYELRVTAGKAKMAIFPAGVVGAKGEITRLVLAPLASSNSVAAWDFSDQLRALQVKELAAEKIATAAGDLAPLSVLLTNSTATGLPPGDLVCFLDGEYAGTGKFPGLEAAKSLSLECKSL